MKNKIFLILVFLILIGCTQSVQLEVSSERESQENNYFKYIEELDLVENFITTCDDFNVKMITNKLGDDEFRQDIIIDDTNLILYNVKVIAKVNDGITCSYPSLGILENEKFTISNDERDTMNNVYKGINLSAITRVEKISIKLMISYYTDEALENLVVRYMQIDNEIR